MTPEILTKCLPRTATPYIGTGGKPDITWQDVLGALHDIPKGTEGFLRFVYMDDPNGRKDFYAGLIRQAINDKHLTQWRESFPGRIDGLVILAVRDWKSWENQSHVSLAFSLGVNRSQWRRNYQRTYDRIVRYPIQWQDDVIRQMKDELLE